jgi:hypothetical protein
VTQLNVLNTIKSRHHLLRQDVIDTRDYTSNHQIEASAGLTYPNIPIFKAVGRGILLQLAADYGTNLHSHSTLAIPSRLIRGLHPPAFKLAQRSRPRLSLFAKHLALRPQFELNTPFSVERLTTVEPIPKIAQSYSTSTKTQTTQTTPPPPPPPQQVQPAFNMSTQETHPTLLIPGPIEFEDDVLKSMSHFRYV